MINFTFTSTKEAPRKTATITVDGKKFGRMTIYQPNPQATPSITLMIRNNFTPRHFDSIEDVKTYILNS